jgi:hypothetical protein
MQVYIGINVYRYGQTQELIWPPYVCPKYGENKRRRPTGDVVFINNIWMGKRRLIGGGGGGYIFTCYTVYQKLVPSSLTLQAQSEVAINFTKL